MRAAAIAELKDQADEAQAAADREGARGRETDAALKAELEPAARRRADLVAATRPSAWPRRRLLADSGQPTTQDLLLERALAPGAEADAEVRAALNASLRDGRSRGWPGASALGVLFTGISLGSILLLVALGLAITYGLMGVINMAHGELMMIGAYATYVVQNLFRAVPAGRVRLLPRSSRSRSRSWPRALVGVVLERSVIRWLYGRPLETLLATWGISLMLMQAVRIDLRRAERGGREPGVDVGRRRSAAATWCCRTTAS